MLKRTITSIIMLPILVALIILGDVPLKISMFVIIVIGMHELYKALSNKKSNKELTIHYVGYLFASVYMFFIDDLHNSNTIAIILISIILSILTLLVIFHKRVTVMDCAVTLFGFCYVTILMSTIYLIRESNYGMYLVWLVFITAWGCDTGAYLVGNFLTGKILGRHKLIPTLSENKTVEGAVGGVVTATILSIIYGIIISKTASNDDPIRILIFASIGIFGGIFSQFGDLTASAIKRYTKIKDFGSILPGHGGILDRFDSVMFTAPAIYLIILLFI